MENRRSSGYDSEKLAYSLARQQELVAEGRAAKSVPVVTQTQVAHKAAFNSVKAKWTQIADTEPEPKVEPPQRRLSTAKSLSNLGARNASVSSPAATAAKK